MKRNDAPAALPAGRRPSLWGRFLRFKQSMGVRSRIFLYFLVFTALLLMLLWLYACISILFYGALFNCMLFDWKRPEETEQCSDT